MKLQLRTSSLPLLLPGKEEVFKVSSSNFPKEGRLKRFE
jgi:hypothetical protein